MKEELKKEESEMRIEMNEDFGGKVSVETSIPEERNEEEEPKCAKWQQDWSKVYLSCDAVVLKVYKLVQKLCPEFKVDIEMLQDEIEVFSECVYFNYDKTDALENLGIFHDLINIMLDIQNNYDN